MGSRDNRRTTAERPATSQQQRRVSRGRPERKPRRVSVIRPGAGQGTSAESVVRHGTFQRASEQPTQSQLPSNAVQRWFEQVIRQGGVTGIRQQFTNNIKYYRKLNATMKAFEDPNNLPYMRYKFSLLDDTRVKLTRWPNAVDSDFIHANYITGLPYRMICAQGPVDESIDRFWMMVAQERVGVIVQLCQFVEDGREKCAMYLPTPGEPIAEGPVTVRIRETQKIVATIPAIKKTTLGLRVAGSNEEIEVIHLLYDAWPDGCVPLNSSDFHHFRKIAHNTTMQKKCAMLVHCSAGVGRTGAFAAIELGHHWLIDMDMDTNLQVLVRELRDQRARAISTDLQYVFVHRALVDAAQEEGKLTPEGKRQAAEFFQEYNALMDRKREEWRQFFANRNDPK